VSTTSARYAQILESLSDKEYRDIFVEEEINTGLPFQIRAIRQSREWSQQELAERVGMKQGSISRLESVGYARFSLATLKRLASVFDVALVVRFVPFSQLAASVASLSSEDLAVPDFEHDPGIATAVRVRDCGLEIGKFAANKGVFIQTERATRPVNEASQGNQRWYQDMQRADPQYVLVHRNRAVPDSKSGRGVNMTYPTGKDDGSGSAMER
jgi:transcriptional regulator with XRE-family HTH domain